MRVVSWVVINAILTSFNFDKLAGCDLAQADIFERFISFVVSALGAPSLTIVSLLETIPPSEYVKFVQVCCIWVDTEFAFMR